MAKLWPIGHTCPAPLGYIREAFIRRPSQEITTTKLIRYRLRVNIYGHVIDFSFI